MLLVAQLLADTVRRADRRQASDLEPHPEPVAAAQS
jgi:hypothetical protein